jgi:hypothetical protein
MKCEGFDQVGHTVMNRDSQGSPWERAHRLLSKAGVCPDGGHVDEPGGCQGDGSDTQGQIFREEVVWVDKGPGTIEGGGQSDAAKPVRQ